MTAALVFALAILVRVAMPDGLMVSAGAGSASGFVICTGHGALQLDSRSGDSAPENHSRHICDFAAMGAPTEAVEPLRLIVPTRVVYLNLLGEVADTGALPARTALKPPSQAPPAFL